MNQLLYTWRYYSYGRDMYQECMSKIFITNLNGLRQANILACGFLLCFSLVPLFFGRNFVDMGICMAAAGIAALFAAYLNYKMQTAIVGSRLIYLFMVLFYINVIGLGIYMGVWVYQDKAAALFICFLLCALLMFVNPPVFNLCLTLGAVGAFAVCAILVKAHTGIMFDIVNAVIAGTLGLYFSWQSTKLRIGLELSANMLEEERNKYHDQSTIDELTQLNNRRDFMKTFQRYLSSYRPSDNWLCISISDIDFFKLYNDHYGHPKGDDCLRSIGSAFIRLREDMGVYTARVGGEEFAIIWFESDASHVDTVVTHMINLVRNMKIPHEKSKVSEFVSISMGIYIERVGEADGVSELYNLADKALYTAKESGRNRAIISGRDIEQYTIA